MMRASSPSELFKTQYSLSDEDNADFRSYSLNVLAGDSITFQLPTNSSTSNNFQQGSSLQKQRDEVLVQQFDELGIQEYEYTDIVQPQSVAQHSNFHEHATGQDFLPLQRHQYNPSCYSADNENVNYAKEEYFKELQHIQERLKKVRVNLNGEEWRSMGEVMLSLGDLTFLFQNTTDALALEKLKATQMKEQLQLQWKHIASLRQEAQELRERLKKQENANHFPNFSPFSYRLPDTVAGIETPVTTLHSTLHTTKQSSSDTTFSESPDSARTSSVNGNNTTCNNVTSNALRMSVFAAPFVPTSQS
eukprot:TRINITY_DN30844_c1_g2_i9.p1 TRINITY_DN30844_c1_g2~~TRINITY_DN30844_c1_g2_i9.p1  ORF type:complete len:305 (-),score=29.65 TRINITY_DN30844_c1_g2_i9:350-1264(-)